MSSNFTQFFQCSNEILIHARNYSDSIFVIKYGGSAMKNDSLKFQVIKDICFLYSLGIKIVLVHGGGPFINNWLSKFNIVPKFVDGVRITDEFTMEVVEMVLSGQVNKNLVSLFNQHQVSSIGLSGKDSNLIVASALFPSSDNLVGKIEDVNCNLLNTLLDNKYIPVIASIGSDGFNKTYNINADTVAGFIAQSLNAEKLILLTDTPGVMTDIHDPSTLVNSLNLSLIQKFKDENIISGGMIPKVNCCMDAVKSNVKSAHIISGVLSHSLLYETLTFQRIGSMIVL